jgi:hypothetical protein
MKWLFLILLFSTIGTLAQDSTEKVSKWELNGYIKSLQSVNVSGNSNNMLATNLLHNRINTRWKPGSGIIVAAEFRTRLIWGDEVRQLPGYAAQLRNSNEFKDLSLTWIDKNPMVLHTNTERLWISWDKKKWTIRAGRQRINWGITTVWNPNDIFNTYNFLDFDYEERPGSDAVKIKYSTGDFSNVELAYAAGNQSAKPVAAVKYDFNKKGYDVQLLAGLYQNRLTAGAGWAGSIREAGFKGELQFYSRTTTQKAHFNASMESDYAFKNGWYLNAGILYNSEGFSRAVRNFDSLSFKFSPVSLMPTQWNFMVTGSKEFTPLFTGNLSVLFAPGTNLLLVLPSLRYNLATNLDADFVWQSFFAETNRFEAMNHRAFLRLKFSF